MAQAGKGKLNYRCPSCFLRDIDIDMFYDKEKKEYYCIRCNYCGTEKEVLAMNEVAKSRYKRMMERIIDFDKDYTEEKK